MSGRAPNAYGPRPRFLWTSLWSLLLLALIVLYYSLLIAASFHLSRWSLLLCRGGLANLPSGWALGQLAASLLLLGLLCKVVWRVGTGIGGLVTTRHDGGDTEVGGVPIGDGSHPLYQLAREVAALVGAPAADEIRLSHRAECFAAECREFSVQPRRTLILVLGLPHFCVLTVEEMRTVMAHELAHFRGDTTLGVFVFRFLESLRQSVSRRDGLRYLDVEYLYSSLCFHLYCALATPLQRQQEFRADHAAAWVGGSEVAVRTLLKEWLLSIQFDASVASHTNWESEPSSVYGSFMGRWREFSPSGLAYLEDRLSKEERPSFWDSHPTMSERVRAIRTYRAPGMPLADGWGDGESDGGHCDPRSWDAAPAHSLLPDFCAWQSTLSREFLHEVSPIRGSDQSP